MGWSSVSPIPRFRATFAVLLAAVAHLWLQAGALASKPGYSLADFRNYFPYDQESYLAIAINARNGSVAAVEPFTDTGSSYYPRLYYQVMGVLARIVGMDTVVMWTVLGLLVQVLLVLAIGATCVLLTRRWWTGVLGALPFVIGTFSTITTGNWYAVLGSHGVLWGAYGVLFALNGESASLCIAGIGLLALLLVGAGRIREQWRAPVAVLACAAVGALANVQTYSFLTAVYLFAFVAAVFGLLRAGSRVLTLLSIAALAAVLLAGSPVAQVLGPLPMLVLGLLPTLPGLWALVCRWRAPALSCVLATVLTASPTVVATAVGVAKRDPFLLFRESSPAGAHLGVPVAAGLAAGTVLLLTLLLVLVAGIHRRKPLWVACSLGGGIGWALIATNDRWGANQEPYRLWIDGFALVAIALVPLAALVATRYLGHRQPAEEKQAEEKPATVTLSRASRRWAAAGLAAVLLLAGASATDWWSFLRFTRDQGLLSYTSSQAMALPAAISAGGPNSLVLPDPCISPFVLKEQTGARIAFYNLGLAWPDRETAMRKLLAARAAGVFDVDAARAAGVTHVLTDSTCTQRWSGPGLQRISAVGYGGGAALLLLRLT